MYGLNAGVGKFSINRKHVMITAIANTIFDDKFMTIKEELSNPTTDHMLVVERLVLSIIAINASERHHWALL